MRYARRAAAVAAALSFVCPIAAAPGAPASKAPAAATPQTGAPADKSASSPDDVYVLYKLAGDNSLFTFDYGPPASPALNLLGLSPDTTTPATTLTKFATSLPAVFGKQSSQAAAFDFAVASLWEPKSDTTFSRYVRPDNWLYRLQHRFRIGFALKNGSDGGSDPSKAVPSGLATGATLSVIDASDPLMTRRASDGSTYIRRCVERFTPVVMNILSANADFSTEQAQAARALDAFARAEFELKRAQADVADPDKERADLERARAFIADYLPPATASISPPLSARPGGSVERPTSLVTLDPSVAQRLGAQAAAKLQSDLNAAIANALALAQHSGTAGPDAPREQAPADVQTNTPARTTVASMDLNSLQKFVDGEVAIWRDKQTALNQAADKSTAAALTSAIKQQFQVDGVATAFANCATQASRIARFSTDLKIGLGSVWTGSPGELRHLSHNAAVGWLSLKLPIFADLPDANDPKEQSLPVPTSALLFALSGRFGFSEIVSTGNKSAPNIAADTLNGWGGLEWISENWRLAGQVGWVRTWARDNKLASFDENGWRYLVSSQLRLGGLGSGVWLGASYGNAYGNAAALKSSTALVTLSYSPPAPPDIAQNK